MPSSAIAEPVFDIERARANMIEQQIRTWEVLDPSGLDLLHVIRREEFVAPAYRRLAFTDMEVPLRIERPDGTVHDSGERMFAPKVEARLLQELSTKAHEVALEIGTGSGYMAALLAHRVQRVVSVEIQPELKRFAESNLARNGVRNVRVELGDGARGWPTPGAGGPPAPAAYDIIVVSGALPVLPETLLSQLKVGGRLSAIVGESPAMSAQIVTRVEERVYETVRLFETDMKLLANAWRPSAFRF
jgi:protein-L-isoaspartate(D-aspartate) O-methyltransferase